MIIALNYVGDDRDVVVYGPFKTVEAMEKFCLDACKQRLEDADLTEDDGWSAFDNGAGWIGCFDDDGCTDYYFEFPTINNPDNGIVEEM